MTPRSMRWWTWRIRLAGAVLLMAALWYATWLYTSIDLAAWWCALPFAAANALLIASAVVTVVNNWRRDVPEERLVAWGAEPEVVVIVPTCGEPPAMVARTVRSILDQEWPPEKLRVIIGDDAHSRAVEAVAMLLQEQYPLATVVYHAPPRRGAAERRGDAKAGNLNSALDLAAARFPSAPYIETRDADDLVGDRVFLRQCVGQLEHDPRLAYVQTIKEARVSPGDPFNNNDPLFYRGSMLAKHAANAVVPCGSGLVWRRAALADIGGFPAWNLVEDLQSGVEALRRGWRGAFLPIVGVLSQHAPEDIPNVYKQRGVWAMDTVRLLLWGDLRGLRLRQRLHFLEMGLFYALSFASTTFLLVPVISLIWRVHPLLTTQWSYAAHFWPFAAALETFLAVINGRQSYETLWRARQMWLGLSVVYMKACIAALVAGRDRKPVYRVTRKEDCFRLYWRETLPQSAGMVVLGGAILYGIKTTPVLTELDLGSALWASFFILMLGAFVRKTWFGWDRPRRAIRWVTAPLHRPPAAWRSMGLDADGTLLAPDDRGVEMGEQPAWR